MEPKIRFKGYSNTWEEKPLLDVVTLYNGLTYTPGDIRNRGTLVLRSSNVQEGEISLLDNVYVRSEVATSPNVEKGDIIVVVRNGSRALIGKHAQIKTAMPNTVIGAFMAGMHTDEPEFVNALLSTSRFDNEVTINLGATINQITNGTFRSMKFMFPDKTEQNTIGAYFQHIDSLIQSTSRKIDSLKQVKAASLQSMFPQNGERTPRVRFDEFKEEWANVSLGEETYPAGIKNRDNLPLESYSISNEFGFIPQNVQFENGGTMATADKRMYYIVSKNSFGYNPARINVGSLGYYSGEDDVIVSSLYEIFKTTDRIYDIFLLYWFKTSSFQKLIEQYQEGGVRFYFFYDKLCMCNLLIPSYDEQKKIADYFTNLDTQISLQKQRLEKLKQIKSACLEKMFV